MRKNVTLGGKASSPLTLVDINLNEILNVEKKTFRHNDIHSSIIIVKKQKQPKRSTTDEWLYKLQHIHFLEILYSKLLRLLFYLVFSIFQIPFNEHELPL